MLVDTDILVDYLRDIPNAVSFVETHVNQIRMSAISVAELYQGVKDGKERKALDAMVSAFTILPVSEEIAIQAGLLRRKFHKSHGCGLADCLIAATAMAHNLPLRSFNTKHYPMVEDVAVPYQKD